MSGDGRTLAGFCGIYCGSCPIYRASHDGDETETLRMAFTTRLTLDRICCEGCRSGDRFVLSNKCNYRSCAKGRGLEACSFCEEYPCEMLSAFYGDGTVTQTEAVGNSRRMKEIGVDAWLDEAGKRWRCGRCGAPQTVGASECRSCDNK